MKSGYNNVFSYSGLPGALLPVIPSPARDLYANIDNIFTEILRLRFAPLRMTETENDLSDSQKFFRQPEKISWS